MLLILNIIYSWNINLNQHAWLEVERNGVNHAAIPLSYQYLNASLAILCDIMI